MEKSPRLPSNWLPLEYELLEYATILPPGLAEKIGLELEASERRLAQLRSTNSLLLRACQDQGMALTAKASPTKVRSPEIVRQLREASREEARVEVRRRLASKTTAKQLEDQIVEVRWAAEVEIQALASREKALQAQQKQLTMEAEQDSLQNKKRLFEIEAKLQKLKIRVLQLENARRHSERRALQREEEDRDLKAEIEYMQTEVNGFRAQTQEFNSIDHEEEELRLKLRSAKTELKALNREQAASSIAKVSDRIKAMETSLAPASQVPRKGLDTRSSVQSQSLRASATPQRARGR